MIISLGLSPCSSCALSALCSSCLAVFLPWGWCLHLPPCCASAVLVYLAGSQVRCRSAGPPFSGVHRAACVRGNSVTSLPSQPVCCCF